MSTHTKLAGFSLEELREEIERRERPSHPQHYDLQEIEWGAVLSNVENLVSRVEAGDGPPDDFEDDCFRIVMEVVYGTDVWTWWNRKMRGR